MDPRHIVILKAAKMGGIVGNNSGEIAMLDSLVSAGYLERQDREAPFPGRAIPPPIYRITALGSAALVENEPSQI
jgi:hypothetical protein